MPDWLALATGIAAGVVAIATAVKVLGLDRVLVGIRRFLEDWQGEPDRPGYTGRPSFPQRMAEVERRAQSVEHFVRSDTSARLMLIAKDVANSNEQATKNHDELVRVNQRITEHRRRNDEQITLLRQAVERLERRGDPPEST